MNIAETLAYLRPGASWMCWDNDPSRLEWFDVVQTRPTVGEINAAWGSVQISAAKKAKLAQLEQARDAAERANVTVAGKVYSGSEAFQAKVSRAVNQTGRGKPIAGANDAWRTVDAQPVVMTAALLGLIEDAITAQGAAAWARYWQRVDAVQAAANNEAVNGIDW